MAITKDSDVKLFHLLDISVQNIKEITIDLIIILSKYIFECSIFTCLHNLNGEKLDLSLI